MRTFLLLLLIPLVCMATSCRKKGCTDDRALNYEADATIDDGGCITINYESFTEYSFENVDYSGQTARLDMLAEMTTYMKTAATTGVTLDAQQLHEMFANSGNHWTDPNLATSGKDLKSKCFSLHQQLFEDYMNNLAAASQATTPGSEGVAGVVTSISDPSKKYLFDGNGIEWTQMIEKGLMGAVFYYRVAEEYTREDEIGEDVDNTTITPGQGTPMQHHWDEAFGYFGAPTTFPADIDQARFIAKYCNDRDAVLATNDALMSAYIHGRVAISSNQRLEIDESAVEVRNQWERVIGGTAIHYLNEAKADFADDALRNHDLSEARAFIGALRYNSDRLISDQQLTDLLAELGDSNYAITISKITSVRDQLSTIMGMTSITEVL